MATATTPAERAAKARWARRRNRLIGYGQWQPWTDAQPARDHINTIRATGMGVRTIATHAGISVATIDHLLYGTTPYPPAARIRPETAAKLLAYQPTLDHYPDRATIDATGTRRRLQALGAAGWPATAIHQHIGFVTLHTLHRLGSNKRVTARLARAVRDMYRWAIDAHPEAHGVEPWIAERCRRHAAANRWPPAAAWDDIDNPRERPKLGDQAPRIAALAEDGLWLEAQGHTRRQAADRLGVSKDALQQAISRWREAQASPDEQQQEVAA